MRISTKGRYALTIMLNLALNYESGRYVPLKEISNNENISFKYLEKIMLDLNKKDYFDISRGINGGYKLKKDPKEYIIGDILRASKEEIEPVTCISNVCDMKNNCKTFPIWKDLNNVVNNFLDNKTLADYIERSNIC